MKMAPKFLGFKLSQLRPPLPQLKPERHAEALSPETTRALVCLQAGEAHCEVLPPSLTS